MSTRFFTCLLAIGVSFTGSVAAQRAAGPTVASVQPAQALGTRAAKVAPATAPTRAVVAPAVVPVAAPVAASTLAFKPDSIFINPDVRPQFTGGDGGLRAYLMKNLRYPEQALRQHVSGQVFVRFVLSAAGRVTDASVVRGPGRGLNEEALRLVWMMPAWQPAYQRGQAVRVSCTLPITFQE
ncbi:MAG: energy transducer TonB [Janthinobacterium lividum]